MNDSVASAAGSRVLQSGQTLFNEGEAADCAYIIESGELTITTHSEGEEVFLCTLRDGDIVGEMGVIDRAPRTATAVASAETSLLVITRNQLTERISEADPILKLLIKILLDRYRSGLSSVKGEMNARPGEELVPADVVAEYVSHGIDKMRLEAELKQALRQRQLQVFYQPLLDVDSRTVAGFEALTRWDHPNRGAISPGLFITLAEETSLIVPVGLYVFEEACNKLMAFDEAEQQHGQGPLFMSINVSARQVADPEFIVQAASLVTNLGLDPARIKLEITEGLSIDIGSTINWINQAHDLGFKVSLDDFGTGYSSLATLHKLPLDTAKIDQAFIRNLEHDARSRELLRGIVNLMRGLGVEIVVEGIETRTHLEFITALDCNLAQGYLIGKPMTASAVTELLVEGPNLTG